MRQLFKLRRILFIIPILLFASCLDNGLEEDTSGILGEESFYKTESDLNAAIIPIYQAMSGSFRNAQGQLTMYGGDDITTIPGSNKAEFRQWDRFDYSSTSSWMKSFCYIPYWQTIYKANAVINNRDNFKVTDGKRKKGVAQARFMRGFSYFMLVRQFGGVPIITDQPATGEETRASVLEVYKVIESDLKFAANNLPSSWGTETAKVTSGAAHTVLADLYLTWAGWPVKDETKYSLAAKEANIVMESGEYRLLDNFANLWQPTSDFNDEDIFEIAWNKNTDYQSMAIGYMPLDEAGWVDGIAELSLFKRTPESPRKKATYYTTFVNAPEGNLDWTQAQFQKPSYKKWIDGGIPGGGNPHRYGVRNVPVYRYAQVLLTFAEADAMANGSPSSKDYKAINAVRERAGVPDLTPNLGLVAFRDSVIRERSFEFAGEYVRWFDEVRTETVEKFSGQMRDPDDLPLAHKPSKKNYISPLPQSEIRKNPNLIQNPEGNKIK